MKIIYIDDENEFEPLIRGACDRLSSTFNKTVEYHSLIPQTPENPRNDLPVFLDDEGEPIRSLRELGDVSSGDVIWRSQLDPFINERDSVYLLDINFGRLLPDYGLKIAGYLRQRGVSVYRILLFSNYPERGNFAKSQRVPDNAWHFTFDKKDFRFQNEVQKDQAVAKLTNQIIGLFRDEIITAVTHWEGEGIVGESKVWRDVIDQTNKIIGTDVTVLVLGESGTGKEVVSRMIHDNGPRAAKPFVAVNCGAFPEHLIESELFGYESGAFTGAGRHGKPGRFELANGGTLFLDELGDLSLLTQVKLLRAIEEGEIQRLGGTQTIKVDVRVIAATNKDLEKAVSEGSFRGDLYHRLNVMELRLPALRDRRDDIPTFVNHFIHKFASTHNRQVNDISPQAMNRLLNHSWPGNIRQLENAIERAVLMSTGGIIEVEDLPSYLVDLKKQGGAAGILDKWNEIEGKIKGSGKHFSAGLLSLVEKLEVDEDAKNDLWETLRLSTFIICEAKSIAESNQSLMQIVALLDSLMSGARGEDGRLAPSDLESLCRTAGAQTPLRNFDGFKTQSGNYRSLGNSRRARWSADDDNRLVRFIKTRVSQAKGQMHSAAL